jgi:hypothetical protein
MKYEVEQEKMKELNNPTPKRVVVDTREEDDAAEAAAAEAAASRYR